MEFLPTSVYACILLNTHGLTQICGEVDVLGVRLKAVHKSWQGPDLEY